MDVGKAMQFFKTTPQIAALCTQNGWPDTDTLQVDIIERKESEVVCAVSFEEILMEGAGCVAGRVSCWGRFRLRLDAAGQIRNAELAD